MKKPLIKKILTGAVSMAMVMTMMPAQAFADEQAGAVTSFKDLYRSLGVAVQDGEGYYDAITSATNFTSFHAKDIPGTNNMEVTDNVVVVKGEEQNQKALTGVKLIGKEQAVTPLLASASHTDSCKYGSDEFIVVPDDTVEGYVWNDYLAGIYAVTVSNGETTVGAAPWIDYYGESATSGPHYNKVEIALNSGIATGSNGVTENAAMVHRYDAFYSDGKLIPGTYTVTVYSEGFTPLTAEIVVPDYEFMYAALDWDEYWTAEDVYAAGSTASSETLDGKGEADLGAFDAVTRATTNHGLHRGNYQCTVTIFDTEGNTYETAYWSEDGKTLYLTDGSSITMAKDRESGITTITTSGGETAIFDHYTVNGIKYVPVKVERKDLEAFKAAYATVENGGTLAGGYGEVNLKAYSETAAVDKTTNGLKTVTKNEDGTFTFSKAQAGKGSGLADKEIKTVDMDKLEVTVKEASGAYGEFLRVDFNGEAYGDLGANMQAVIWKYYGDVDASLIGKRGGPVALATYGTKFAADNWMHKSMGIQLGLTKSERCQLPEGTDGTGVWQITVKALGYTDTTVTVQVADENIVKPEPEVVEVIKTELLDKIDEAKALVEDEYTETSWAALKAELDESIELVSKENATQSEIDEQISHLSDAIKNLERKPVEPVVKAESAITLKAKTVTYSGKAVAIDAATVTGSKGEVTYKYYKDAECKTEVEEKDILNAGTYYVKAFVAEDDNYKSAESKAVKLIISKAKTTVKLQAKTVTYTGKAVAIGAASVEGSKGTVAYAYYKDKNCTKTVKTGDVMNAGTYYVKATVAEDKNYKSGASNVAKLVIKKAGQTLKVSAASKSVKVSKVKKTAQLTSKISVTGAKTAVTYKKVSGSSKLTLSNGKIKVKKGTKKGTYSIKVKVSAKAGTNYNAASKTVTVKVKVK